MISGPDNRSNKEETQHTAMMKLMRRSGDTNARRAAADLISVVNMAYGWEGRKDPLPASGTAVDWLHRGSAFMTSIPRMVWTEVGSGS